MTKPTMRDASASVTRSLPNGAANVSSTPIDLMAGANSDFVAPVELIITAPAVNATQLPDTQTLTYELEHSADNSSWSPLARQVIIQTGAGGAGAAGSAKRFKPPTDVFRYVRLKATKSGTGDASGAEAVMALVQYA
jgi:hypothetical protein